MHAMCRADLWPKIAAYFGNEAGALAVSESSDSQCQRLPSRASAITHQKPSLWMCMYVCAGPPLKVPLTTLMAHHNDTWRAVQVGTTDVRSARWSSRIAATGLVWIWSQCVQLLSWCLPAPPGEASAEAPEAAVRGVQLRERRRHVHL